MNKKILIISSSPKGIFKSKNFKAAEEIIKGISFEYEFNLIDLSSLQITPCQGCLACLSNGGNCILPDNFKEYLNLIKQSDIIIISFPLYGVSFPALLENFIERCLPFHSSDMERRETYYTAKLRYDFSNKIVLGVCGCGCPYYKGDTIFNLMEDQFHYTFKNLFGINNTYFIAVPNIEYKRPNSKKLQDIGKNLLSSSDILISKIDSFINECSFKKEELI